MRRSPLDTLSFKLVALIAAVLVGVVIGAAVLGGGDGDDGGDETTATLPASATPTPVPAPADSGIVKGKTDRDLLAAQRAARRFITSYLPVLYGRAKPQTVSGATAALRTDLRRNVRRLPPAMQERTPRIEGLDVVRQAEGAVQATATIADGDVSTFPLIFYLERGPRGWRATSLGDD